MQNDFFDKSAVEQIIKKIKEDSSGQLARIMQKILEISEEAGKKGFTIQELSIIVTTGWYLSQSPELKSFFDELLSMPPPPNDDVWN